MFAIAGFASTARARPMQHQQRIYNRIKFAELLSALDQHPRPQGLRGSLHATIDNLVQCAGPPEIIETACAMSLLVLRMDWAVLNGDHETAAACRKKMRDHANDWITRNGTEPATIVPISAVLARRKRLN